MYLLILLSIFLFICATADNVSVYTENCGITKGCLFAPPGCENSSTLNCTSIFTWTVQNNGIQFMIAASPIANPPSSNSLYYAAVGLSLDEYMGDDTVITCFTSYSSTNLTSTVRPGTILISWNDHNDNYILFQASQAILQVNQVGVQDSRFQCSGFWNFSGRTNIKMNPERTYDLSNPNMAWHILFARGTADVYTYDLHIHSLHDDNGFPWVTHDTLSFCTQNGCGVSYQYLNQIHQSLIPRVVKTKIAVSHGLVMFICWWILISSGILTARFGKKFNYRFLGSAIWFQIHRSLMFLAFCCITVVFFLIYWQHNWRVFSCSTICGIDDYNTQVHALLGTVTYAFLMFQVLIGILRPGLDSPIRPYFNLIHRLNGMLIWGGASVNMFLGVDMGKTGLRAMYKGWPYFIMALVIMIFIFTWALCEWFAFRSKFIPENSNSVQKLNYDDEDHDNEKPSIIAALLIFMNSLVGIAGAIAIGIMLTDFLKMLGFFA